MSDVIRVALDKLTETAEFGQAIIEAQMLDRISYAIYDGQQWHIANAQQVAIKQAEMVISLPELDREKYQLFAEVYLDDQQALGLFSECWQGSTAQWYCSNEMHMYLDMLLEEDRQISAQPTAKKQPAA